MSRTDRRYSGPGFPGVAFLLSAFVGSAVLVAAALAGAEVMHLTILAPPVLAAACYVSYRWARKAHRTRESSSVVVTGALAPEAIVLGIRSTLSTDLTGAIGRGWQDWVWVPPDGTAAADLLPGAAALCEAAHAGLLVERVLILPDAVWLPSEVLPSGAVRGWIEEQHNHGLWLVLIRHSAALAIGTETVDGGVLDRQLAWARDLVSGSPTLRLDTTPESVASATRVWQRLSERGTPYRVLLDRTEPAR